MKDLQVDGSCILDHFAVFLSVFLSGAYRRLNASGFFIQVANIP